ncbi:MAG TPA: hypothetical protein VF882_07880 [Gemmatimonadales bacterium]
MLRTFLAGLVVIGLAACGSGAKPAGSKGSTAGSAKPATTSPQRSAKQPKRKAAPDTSHTRNPLTND